MKIICIGRNYANHAKELNNPIPEEPVIFMKPDSSLIRNNQPFFIPDFSTDVHHEVELVVKINKLGRHIDKKFAHKYYNEISIGIDFTARDLQSKMKEKGLPWEKAKGFDGSAPLGKFVPKSTFSDIENISFHLDINGKRVQTGNTSNMLFSIDTIVEHVSKYFTLKIGDLIYTGTPEGVGPVKAGDRLACFIEEEELLAFNIR